MRTFFIGILTGGFLASSALADGSNSMIVFDASGSMWGQIEGKTKIEIARDAFANAQGVWEEGGQNVGLIAYGHRRKGDCTDIETLVPLTDGGTARIAEQIQTLRPRGKTPLSDAIRLAASELRFREEAATVVLFSDGIETCNADPCALAAELEQDGIDFTAHVIGFGLGSDTDRTQLKCIAQNTGGQFLEASDAAGVQDALRRVAEAPVPADPTPKALEMISLRIVVVEAEGTARPDQITFRATDTASGEKRALGTMRGAQEVIEGLQAELPVGDWLIEAISQEGGGEVTLTVAADTQQVEVPFKANDTGFVLLADGPYRLGVEHAFFLGVTDPLQVNAEYTVALYPAGATEFGQRIDWETRFGSDSTVFSEHGFTSPQTPGDYEIIVVQGYDLSAAQARFPVTYQASAPIRWMGETRGQPGEALPIRISGDVYRNNTLALRAADGTEIISQWLQEYVTPETGPVLILPEEAGVYELFYRASSEEGELTLGKIVVGDVILEDDPDAVAAPKTQEPSAETSPGTDIVFQCDQPACFYFSEALEIGDVPILEGFGVANETRDDEQRPSFDVINLETGDRITVNPVFMVNTMDCFVTSENGRNEGMEQDTLCLSKESNGATISQFESLEGWLAAENDKALEADLVKDRAAHDATMGEDMIFTTSSLDGGWSIRDQQSGDIVGIVAIDTAGEGTLSLDILLYGGSATGLDGAKQFELPATPVTDDTTQLVGILATSRDLNLQLNRPSKWDGANNEFSGILVVPMTGKTLKVEMF